MKKIYTMYSKGNIYITVNAELNDHISIHEDSEPCSGIIKHWGSKQEIISELKRIIKLIEELK